MINARTKGATGERQFCKWLEKNFELDFLPQRNLEQVRSGGHDVYVDPFIFEVKRVEKLQLQSWWLQIIKASEKIEHSIPVVAFRQNGNKWSFLISAQIIGVKGGFIQLTEKTFIYWAKQHLVADPGQDTLPLVNVNKFMT